MEKFNIFFVKYLISEAIIRKAQEKGLVAEVLPTAQPEDATKFFKNIAANGADYNRFGEEWVRISLSSAVTNHLYYMCFRTGKQTLPNGKYHFGRPSSVEIGTVVDGAFSPIKKIHYKDYWGDTLDCQTAEEARAAAKGFCKELTEVFAPLN